MLKIVFGDLPTKGWRSCYIFRRVRVRPVVLYKVEVGSKVDSDSCV